MQLEDFKDKHKGESILVLGCGPSAYRKEKVVSPYTTIAVNDAADMCGLKKVDYNLVCDPVSRLFGRNTLTPCSAFFYRENDWEDLLDAHVLGMTATYVPYKTSPILIGQKEAEHPLRHSIMSPFVAVTLAAYMGASCIGILGVDLIPDGSGHELCKPLNMKRSHHDWSILRRFVYPGATLVNCSPDSRLDALYKPKEGIAFLNKRSKK